MTKNIANTDTRFFLVCQRKLLSIVQNLRLYTLLLCIVLCGLSLENLEGSELKKEPVQLEMLSEHEHATKGSPFWVLFRFSLEPDWHIYWKNPGDAGFAPQISWHLPEGFQVEEVLWPHPEKYDFNGIISFGYAHEALLLAKILPAKTAAGRHSIGADVHWVACDDSTCLPGQVSVQQDIFFDDSPAATESPHRALFLKAQNQIPQKYEGIVPQVGQNGITFEIPSQAEVLDVIFFPYEDSLVNHETKIAYSAHPSKQNIYEVAFEGPSDRDTTGLLGGVLVLKIAGSEEKSKIAYELEAPISHPAVSNTDLYEGGLLLGLIFAFLGGLLLNLMPCVLPVVSFKVLSFVKMAGKSRAATFRYGLIFSAGVLVSFWILAGTLLLLQSYGHAVGWGFQLQEPLFVAILAALIFLFALSLFGVFELGIGVASKAGKIQSGSRHQGLLGAFMSGVMATAVATPCTGPFLGTAVGFAVTLPVFQAMLIFTSLAIGMAFPYAVLGAFPRLLRFLPKPGNWMIAFKEMMGFLMLATVLWLVWVFESQTGGQALFLLLCTFFLLGIAAWIYGKWGTPACRKRTRICAYISTLAIFFSAGYVLLFSTQQGFEDKAANIVAASDWEPFSRERFDALREQGTPVFIDFTAKWCLICQSNHLVLNSEAVKDRFDALGVVKMKADWTKRDAVITEELSKFGRNSVPLYLFYGEEKKPEILPQILSQEVVLQTLEKNRSAVADR